MSLESLQLAHHAIDKTLPVVQAIQWLLKFCIPRAAEFHGDMNSIRSRFEKHRIRGFCKTFFSLPLFEAPILDPVPLELLDLFLSNKLSLRELAEQISDKLAEVRSPEIDPVATTALDEFIAQLPALYADLNENEPFQCLPVTIARGIALGLDDAFAARITSCFNAGAFGEEEPKQLAVGDLFPARVPDAKSYYQSPAFKLVQSEDDIGQLPNFRRLDSQPQLTLRMQSSSLLKGMWPKPNESFRVGFACLGSWEDNGYHVENWSTPYPLGQNVKLPEDDKATHFGAFSQVTYPAEKKRKRGHRVLINILQEAIRSNVEILIYPELCLSDATESALLKLFASAENKTLQLLVVGSRHITLEKKSILVNRLQAFAKVPQGYETYFVHDKLGAFGFRLERQGKQCYWLEDITRSRELNVLVDEGSSTAMIICKDAMQASVLESLVKLSVRRLIVVAMSPKTDEFAVHLSELASRCNTLSLLCCYSEKQEITAGVFGPGRGCASMVLRNGPARTLATQPHAFDNPKKISQPSLAIFKFPVLNKIQASADNKRKQLRLEGFTFQSVATNK